MAPLVNELEALTEGNSIKGSKGERKMKRRDQTAPNRKTNPPQQKNAKQERERRIKIRVVISADEKNGSDNIKLK